MEKRIEDLEVRLAFQEESIHELHKSQLRLQQEIDRLNSELGQLQQLLREAVATGLDVTDAPPPHY